MRPPEVRFGIMLGLLRPEVLAALATRVETLGYDSIWSGDHVAFHDPTLESLTTLAYLAAVTRRVRLGTCVYLLALRHPTVAAKTVATLDRLSGGRFVFGVGVGGEFPKEFEACGVPHADRGRRVDEGLFVLGFSAGVERAGEQVERFAAEVMPHFSVGAPAPGGRRP